MRSNANPLSPSKTSLLRIFSEERLGEGPIETDGSGKSAFDILVSADSPKDLGGSQIAPSFFLFFACL